jgi:hypothetical protein
VKPIYNNREIVGYAKNTTQAKNIIKKALQNIPKNWVISVRLRDTSLIDLPEGFIYSVHPQTN